MLAPSGGFHVFGRRGPVTRYIKDALFELARPGVAGDGIFFEAALVADLSPAVAQVQFRGCAITARSRAVLIAERLHDRGQLYIRVNFAQEFLYARFELIVSAFPKVSEA